MTTPILSAKAQHYLKQAAAAPGGIFSVSSVFDRQAVRELVQAGYLVFQTAGGSPYLQTFLLTDAGRAALEAAPATDVPQVEHGAAPVDDLGNDMAGELNAAMGRAEKWRRGQGYPEQLVGYRFRWDGDYGGWKLCSPKPGAPVFQARRFMTWLDHLQDYQVNGIEALKALQAPSAGRGRARVSPDAQAPLWPASTTDPRRPAQIRTATPDQDGEKAGHVADQVTPPITPGPAPITPQLAAVPEAKRTAPAVTDSAAPAQTAVAESTTQAVGGDVPEKPGAAPGNVRWLPEEVRAMSAALTRFGHSIGAHAAQRNVMIIVIENPKHATDAWKAIRAAMPPDALLKPEGKPGVFHLVKLAPTAPPTSPTPAPTAAGDKREQRLVTHNPAPRSSAFDDNKRDAARVTPDQLTPAARHPRTTARPIVFQATCAQCGKPFTASRSDAKTCSATCRKAYSRRGAELRKAYEEASRALAEIGARLRKHPDLVETAADNLETLAREAARLLAECHAGSAAD